VLARKNVAREHTLGAPVGGWNARDPLANMDETDAVMLDNFFPTTGDVVQRLGQVDHVTSIGDPVESLMVYDSATTTKLFAAAGTDFYDVTSAGSSPSSAVGSLTNARWQDVNFKTSAGQYLYAVNGADSPRLYDGSSWTAITGASSPAITGVTTTSLVYVAEHVKRLWFVEKDSLSVWYLGASAIGGAATEFDLGDVFSEGGYLVAMGSWTIDAGEGMDDHAVFITSKGEVAVYKGIDPSSASTWVKVGTFKIAPPIGRKCLFAYKGDLIVITRDGFFPMSKALITDREQSAALSFKIRGAVQDAVAAYSANYGWEGLYYSDAPFLLFNIPIGTTGQHQYVMNTTTGAWCRFKDWDAHCFAVAGDVLYYGSTDSVQKAWFGHADGENNINSDAQQAFSYFKARAKVKRFMLGRPLLKSSGSPAVSLSMNLDYDETGPASLLSFSGSTAGVWDTAEWDADVWGGDPTLIKSWHTLGGVGTAAAVRLQIASKGIETRWTATDITYEVGGVL